MTAIPALSNSDDLLEGATNLFFTTARSNAVTAAIIAGDNLRVLKTGDDITGNLNIDGNLDVTTGAITGITQTVTNRALATWSGTGGLRDNPATWVGSDGDLWLYPYVNDLYALNVDNTLAGGFGGKAKGAFINAVHTGFYSNPIGLLINVEGTQTRTYISCTGDDGTLLGHNGPTSFCELTNRGLDLRDDSSTATAPILNLELGGDPPPGVFARFTSGQRTEFQLDSSGNMLVGGAYISTLGGVGTFGNLVKYSEQLNRASRWIQYGGGTTITTNYHDAPDGTPNKAGRLNTTNNPAGIYQDLGIAAANKTLTVGFWGLRESGSSLTMRCYFGDANGYIAATREHVGLVGNEDKWEYHRITYTYDGAASGNARFYAQFETADDSHGSVHSVHAWEGSRVYGYVPTLDFQVAPFLGSSVVGTLSIGSGYEAAQEIIRAGDNQGTTNLFEVRDKADALQLSIDSGFNWNVGNHNIICGTGSGVQFGTAINQKLAFYGSTPLIQQTPTSQTAATLTPNTSGIVDDTATWNGYTVGDLFAILQAYGILQ